jgi:hypothetical protein
MRKHFTKKRVVLLAIAALAIGIGTTAFAYFTSTGSGTGSATVGAATNWTVGESVSPTGGAMYPDAAIGGAHVQTHGYTVTNGGNGSQYLTQVVIKIANADGSPWDGPGTCSASDFSVGGQPVGTAWTDTALAGTFTSGQSKTTGSVTVEMIDNNANQNDCQSATVPLYFFAS